VKRIVIIGGGVAGLGAAYRVRRAADAGHPVEFVLLEKDDRLGGKLFTDTFVDENGGRYVADGGSDSFLTDKTAVHRVARLLGIFEEETGTMDENKKVMAFDAQDCPFSKDWHGILSPMVEHRPLTGVSLMSSKWPNRAPQGTVMLRGPGRRDRDALCRDRGFRARGRGIPRGGCAQLLGERGEGGQQGARRDGHPAG
jgi:protoporphyrinogen oxidase